MMLGRYRGRVLALAVALVAVGCVASTRIPRPADFPLHAADHPFFDLHWRVDRLDGVVRATGLVEATRVSGVARVIVELAGLDRGGQVVSRARAGTYEGPLYRGDARPFVVRLRPRGQEERFDLKVWGFDWDTRGDGGERAP